MSDVKPARDRWNDAIVPAARGLESFFWKLAWFVVFLALLFGGECRRMLTPERMPNDHVRPADIESSNLLDLRTPAHSRTTEPSAGVPAVVKEASGSSASNLRSTRRR